MLFAGALTLFAMPGNAAEKPKNPANVAALEQGPVSGLDSLKKLHVPGVLSQRDISRYRVIFELQEDGDWAQADKIIADLEDPILMGHVLAQRYLHPTKYRSKYKELKDWLAKYHDHPEARRIYDLAMRRKPKNWKPPHPPSAMG